MNPALPPIVEKRVHQWLQEPYDSETRKEVQDLLEQNPENLIDAFHTTVSFGTGGMRGLMGVGTNRLNCYTIRSATQGLANYILSQKTPRPRVFISYDSRQNSALFAQETARVLAGNGIEVYLTENLRPTPLVSFGCRNHRCTAAIMITASHNPPEYNGYKVYWSDGAQVVPPHDSGIMQEVKKIEHPSEVNLAPLNTPLIHYVGEEEDNAYYHALFPLQNFPEYNQKHGSDLHILYSPLHGCGITTLPAGLSSWGFTSLSYVEEQKNPDGMFPNALSPNPEDEEALKLGIQKLQKQQGDLLIATDPDADRLGLVVRHQGEPVTLSGNQIASLCLYYLCKTLTKQKRMPPRPACVTTIVTTELFKTIAESFGIACFEVLTGFKYIGEKIHEWETQTEGYNFLFGAEESLGFLYGTHARDKDATISACLISEMALQQKKEGKTLIDLLEDLYAQFGPFQEKQLSVTFKGAAGQSKMETLMETLRKSPPKEICGHPLTTIQDYLKKEEKECSTGCVKPLTLPSSNVLVWRLDNQTKFVIRPSGTEPKIKLYGFTRSKDKTNLNIYLQTIQELYLT